MLKRWGGFTSFLGDGRICLTNNAAERALRGFALGRKSWLFAGSDRGADRAAFMATLIMSAKLNDIDPQASDELRCAARDVGFSYLSGHGIPQSLIDDVPGARAASSLCPMRNKLKI